VDGADYRCVGRVLRVLPVLGERDRRVVMGHMVVALGWGGQGGEHVDGAASGEGGPW